MLDLYINIRNRRKELGMSQDELARRVGYTSRSTIARIENGEIDISRSKIVAFANALKITPGELMGLDGTWEEEAADEFFKSRKELFFELSKDNDLMTIIEKATEDSNFRQRLLGIVKLMENDK